jgi:filamentation induced by cAMP protein fic
MQIVSSPPQRLQIHHEALPAERIEYEMANFLNFINKSSDNPYIKSAIAHLWFAIVHLMMTAMDAWQGLWRIFVCLIAGSRFTLSQALFTKIKKLL